MKHSNLVTNIASYYSLLVTTGYSEDSITSLVTEHVNGSTHKRTFGNEITYNLPINQAENFPGQSSVLVPLICAVSREP